MVFNGLLLLPSTGIIVEWLNSIYACLLLYSTGFVLAKHSGCNSRVTKNAIRLDKACVCKIKFNCKLYRP